MSRIATSITISMRELDRLKTIRRVVDRMLRVGQAAEGLGISCRQLERLVKRYEAGGAAGLVSAKCGRPIEAGLWKPRHRRAQSRWREPALRVLRPASCRQ
jgi:hypothetical protein